MKKTLLIVAFVSFAAVSCKTEGGNVIVYQAPEGIVLNSKYKVAVEGKDVPVFNVKVGHADREQRHIGMDDKANSANYYDIAGMAYFDLKRGPVTVTVTVADDIKEAKILPTSYGITPVVDGKTLKFQVDKPQNLTIDINGDYVRSLHLFVNEEEKDIPDPNDPDVVYFGPGIHEVSTMQIGDNKTVYIAGGAYIQGIIAPDEPFGISGYSGLKVYRGATFALRGKNIKIRGRGIIDQDRCTTHARNMVSVNGEDISMEGIILLNSSTWTIPVRNSKNVKIDNVKLIGHRANSDGIDICASWDVLVENCFIRTLDDLIVVKTTKGTGPAGRIVARKCVLWNEVAHALSVGAEITAPVEDVLFEDCDVIHDHCREWSLRVYQTDKALVKNIRFENIRIEESYRFASLWIGEAIWTSDNERGHIEDVVFRNIQAAGPNPLYAEFKGYDKDHAVRNVLLENVVLNGKRLTMDDVRKNEFVFDVVIK